MKKCTHCSRPATLHITELREGVVQGLLHLCESCAQEYLSGADSSESQSSSADYQEQLAELTGDDDSHLEELTCPSCGINFAEFRSQGRLGCPNDYLVFENELIPLLENIHDEVQHVGKVPRRAPDASQRQYQLIRLRNELRTAVGQENYEEAAALRDRITQLEAELGQQESGDSDSE